MRITVNHPDLFFAGFYILSFIVILILSIDFGKRKRIPARSVLLVLSATLFLTVAGSRLFLVPVSQWGNLFLSGDPGSGIGRSAIGGIVFGLAGFIFAARYAGLDRSAIAFYAWITPVGYGIQKIGCFFNGCCYGTITDSVLGVTYPAGTNAHYMHFAEGAITYNAAESLKVFPVQLLEVLCFLVIGFIVRKAVVKLKKTGSIILFMVMLIMFFRFSSEFLRDHSYSASVTVSGLSTLQWFLLITGILSGIILLSYEKLIKAEIKIWEPSELTNNRTLIFILALSGGLFILRGLFISYEKISLYVTFIPAIFLSGLFILRSLGEFRVKIATASFLAFPLLLVHPTMSSDSLSKGRQESRSGYYGNEPSRFSKIDAGSYFGRVNTTISYSQQGQCGATVQTEDYEHRLLMGGAGYSTSFNNGNFIITPGINVFGGSLEETNLKTDSIKSFSILGINPNIRFDTKWFGAGVGINTGNLRWLYPNQIDQSHFNFFKERSVVPEFSARLGRTDIIDVRYNYGMNSYFNFPALINEVSFGSGFGNKISSTFRVGYAFSEHLEYPFLLGDFLLLDNLNLKLKYDFENKDRYRSFVIGASYRFGLK
jgi:prolipoprotein diacylglyceryltransferase